MELSLLLHLVKKWLYKILMLVAVATIVGHGSMPHHHHLNIQAVAHHHEHLENLGLEPDHHHHNQGKEDHHNIFSFAQLDEDFVHSQFSKTNIDLPVLYLLTPIITFHLQEIKQQSKTQFGCYREFPPPGKFISSLFSRPPPLGFTV